MGGAPAFRGAVAVGRPLAGGPVATTTLLALELWEDSLVATLVEFAEPGAVSAGIQASGAMTWSATSDAGSIHRGVSGGGGTAGADHLLDWRLTLTPGLPPAARTVDVRFGIGADVVAGTVDLAGGPPVRRPALVEVDDDAARDADPDCMSCGPPLPPSPPLPRVEQLPVAPGLELDWLMPVPPAPEPRPSFRADHRRLCPTCRTIRDGVFAAKVPTGPVPERVVALGAELGPLFGARLVVPALVVWPGWFDLTVVGERRGAWGDTLLAAPVGGSRWAAVDDRGRHYDGAAMGAGSDGRLVHRDLSFAPALAPDARTLTLLVPISYDGWARRVTIDL